MSVVCLSWNQSKKLFVYWKWGCHYQFTGSIHHSIYSMHFDFLIWNTCWNNQISSKLNRIILLSQMLQYFFHSKVILKRRVSASFITPGLCCIFVLVEYPEKSKKSLLHILSQVLCLNFLLLTKSNTVSRNVEVQNQSYVYLSTTYVRRNRKKYVFSIFCHLKRIFCTKNVTGTLT